MPACWYIQWYCNYDNLFFFVDCYFLQTLEKSIEKKGSNDIVPPSTQKEQGDLIEIEYGWIKLLFIIKFGSMAKLGNCKSFILNSNQGVFWSTQDKSLHRSILLLFKKKTFIFLSNYLWYNGKVEFLSSLLRLKCWILLKCILWDSYRIYHSIQSFRSLFSSMVVLQSAPFHLSTWGKISIWSKETFSCLHYLLGRMD